LYATKYKDLKWPLVVTFGLFIVVTICYGCISPSWNRAQIGLNVISGVGQSGPLTLLVALVQFTAPHAYLSTATGLAFSARAIGGAFGSAVLNAIINGKLSTTLAPQVSAAAISAGLPTTSIPALLEAMGTGDGLDVVPGVSPQIIAAVAAASQWAYTYAYRLAWWSILPFVILALIAVACMKDVKELMTEKVEATVESVLTNHENLAACRV
jgi:hypothetical protein